MIFIEKYYSKKSVLNNYRTGDSISAYVATAGEASRTRSIDFVSIFRSTGLGLNSTKVVFSGVFCTLVLLFMDIAMALVEKLATVIFLI